MENSWGEWDKGRTVSERIECGGFGRKSLLSRVQKKSSTCPKMIPIFGYSTTRKSTFEDLLMGQRFVFGTPDTKSKVFSSILKSIETRARCKRLMHVDN